MNIEVKKEDIKKIGNTKYNEGGFLAIVCDGDTSNIEEILLRTILKCFGDEYKVTIFCLSQTYHMRYMI